MKPFCHRTYVREVHLELAPQITRTHSTQARKNTATRHTGISSEMSSTKHIHSPQASYHVPGVFLKSAPTLTHKVRSTMHILLKTCCHTCVEAASHHISTQQSHQETLVPFASLSAISGTFNSLFKVLFTFPSWYLFAIGLEPIFSFR